MDAHVRDARPATPTPERWYEPAPAPVPVESGRSAEAGRHRRSIVAAALLSAVLASGGTVVALGAAGALDRDAPASAASDRGTNVGAVKPVTIDESLGDHRRRGQGQPRRRPDHRHGQHERG